jgi:hypothetical protein
MNQAEPRVGHIYSCREQSKMHGGNFQKALPESEGEVTLIRFRPNINPNGPDIIEHGDQARISERIDMLRNQGGSLPVYKRVSDARWEYLGRYRVQNVTDDAGATAGREAICGWRPRYIIRLEAAS